ncbi:MAG: hypothetical protein WC374_06920 [Phycisphaerae bacterium]
MIIFYPSSGVCTPIIITDMTDNSDQWSTIRLNIFAPLYKPDDVTATNTPKVYSCKYNYSVQHNGVPLGAALKMSLAAAISSPPSELISRVSVDYVSSAGSINQMSDALAKFANPQVKVMTAVVVERVSATAEISRSFVAYSVVLQPDEYGTNATLYVKGASLNDALIKSEFGFQLDITTPLNAQLSELGGTIGYTCSFDSGVASSVPVSGRLFQPTTLAKILDEICLQNKIIPEIDDKKKTIRFHSANTKPTAAVALNSFSFLGYGKSALMWGVGVENYANVKFKTPIFDAKLFDSIAIYNDSQSALFEGFIQSSPKIGPLIPAAYSAYILRYAISRNDLELCCEVTATNNWLLAQMRIDGILESKIFGGAL